MTYECCVKYIENIDLQKGKYVVFMQKKRVLQGKRNLQPSLMNEIKFLYNEGGTAVSAGLFGAGKMHLSV